MNISATTISIRRKDTSEKRWRAYIGPTIDAPLLRPAGSGATAQMRRTRFVQTPVIVVDLVTHTEDDFVDYRLEDESIDTTYFGIGTALGRNVYDAEARIARGRAA
jgi:hypothetical protein